MLSEPVVKVKSELLWGLPKVAPEVFSRVVEKLPLIEGRKTPFCAATFSCAWRRLACAASSVGLDLSASLISSSSGAE